MKPAKHEARFSLVRACAGRIQRIPIFRKHLKRKRAMAPLVAKACKEYADALGITVAELTTQQKDQAIRSAILEEQKKQSRLKNY